MSDMLSISSTAVSAYQRALSTVSNNIANVSTDGYSRQEVALESNSPARSASYYVGTGVQFGAVKRQFDAFAESNLRKSTSDLMAQDPMVEYTKRVMDIMGDKSVGLSSALDQFFDSARQLSVDPASTVQRASFMRSSDGLASRFAELSGQLDLISVESRQALESAAGQFNSLTSQLALVNQQLNKGAKLEEQPSELLDRRDLLLRQISEFAGIKTAFETNGVVRVSLGATVNQSLVVDRLTARPIGVDTTEGKFDFLLDPYGTTEPLPTINSGTMGGMKNFMSTVLEPAQKSLDFLAKVFVQEVNAIQSTGIDGYGNMGTPLFRIDMTQPHLAAGVQLAVTDPMKVATASLFRVAENNDNAGAARSTVSYTPAAPADLVSNPALGNNPNPAAGLLMKVDEASLYKSVTAISAGVVDPVFYLDNAAENQQLQILTRDGRHVMGKALTLDEKFKIMTPENGFAGGATYSDSYLNLSGEYGYRDIQVMYGARATVQSQQILDKNGQPLPSKLLPAELETSAIARNLEGTVIGAGDLFINGYAMGELKLDGTEVDQPLEIATWINDRKIPGLSAEAFNEIEINPTKIDFKLPLIINSVEITGYSDLKSFVTAIQNQSENTGVTARLDERGQLILANAPEQGGQSIFIDTTDLTDFPVTALGMQPSQMMGRIRLKQVLDVSKPEESNIELTFGPNGAPADLTQLGIRTGAYFTGKVPDDMLVFVTGVGDQATVAASYSGESMNPGVNLRSQSLQLKFVDDQHYVILDTKTQTELARRVYDRSAEQLSIEYQGLQINLNTQAQVGDSFLIDGNLDGVGDNTNMLLMVDLAKKKVIEGKTLSNTYIDQVNDIGNLAQQAKISQQALTVVNDQAIQSRDKVSGVNLDDEAAELIRFQQAYQASAKAMQVSNELFSAIVQIR
jgi:flagellar hook-associated protein FlgK